MKSLCEKYRPATLSDLRGHNLIARQLQSFKRNPSSKAFLFCGSQGTGKTSAAIALANELCGVGTDLDPAWYGLTVIPAGDLTAQSIRDLRLNTLAQHTRFGTGYKVIVCNEFDARSDAAEFLLLEILENLPPKVIFIFTTNELPGVKDGKLSSRFVSRCECHVFKTPVKDFGQGDGAAEVAAQNLIDDVWVKELGHNHSPRLADLDGWRDGGNLSFRSVLQALEPLIRLQRDDDEIAALKVSPIIPVSNPSGRVSALAEMENAARMLQMA